MTRKERAEKIFDWFAKNQPEVNTELEFYDPFELLVAVILSAQCTDQRVNLTTPALFRRFPDARALARSSEEEVFPFIKSISYPNSKAKHLVGMARMLVENYGGKVPETVEELKKLPGVGQKTANVVVSVAFGTPSMPVDTHVFRVAARTGLSRNARNPAQTERQLVEIIPRERLSDAHHWLILHGRYICVARKPKCGECGIRDYCRYFENLLKQEQKAAKKKAEIKDPLKTKRNRTS